MPEENAELAIAADVSRASARRALLGEMALYGGLALLVGALFWPLLSHPRQVLCGTMSDLVALHYPYRYHLAEGLRTTGAIPLWNPTIYGGMPLVGDPISGLFYPFNWLVALWEPQQAANFLSFALLAHMVWGAWGTLFWLGGRGYGAGERVAGAVAFALAAKWCLHLFEAGHLEFLSLVWTPWQLALIDRIAARPRGLTVGLLALATGAAVLSDHPQILFFSQLVVAAYSLAALASDGRPRLLRATLGVGLGGAGGLALAAVHLLPLVQMKSSFVRGGGVPYDIASMLSCNWGDLPGLLLPKLAASRHDFFWEASCYLGAVVVALALVGLGRRNDRARAWTMIGLLIFALWYVLGASGGLHRFMYDYVPGFGLFRIPPRILVVAGLPLAYLTAAGVEILSRSPRRTGSAIVLGTLAAVAVGLLAWQRSPEAVWAVVAVTLLLLAWRWPQRGAVVAALLALLVTVDQVRVVAPLVRVKPWEEIVGSSPLVEMLQAPPGRQRVLAYNPQSIHDYTPLPTIYAIDGGLECVHGYNPFLPQFVDTLVWRDFQIRHLELLNVRWVVSSVPIESPALALRQTLRDVPIYDIDGRRGGRFVLPEIRVYENAAPLPRAGLVRRAVSVGSRSALLAQLSNFDPRVEVLVERSALAGQFPGEYLEVPVEHAGQEIRAHCDAGQGGFLVLSEIWYPGWRATDNGRPARSFRANGGFVAIRLGPGEHDVRLTFRPQSFERGRIYSLATLALVGVVMAGDLLGGLWRRRRGAESAAAA